MKSILNSINFVPSVWKLRNDECAHHFLRTFWQNQKCNEAFHILGGLRCDHKNKQTSMGKKW
jgi:hypothetical protein